MGSKLKKGASEFRVSGAHTLDLVPLEEICAVLGRQGPQSRASAGPGGF